jgi:hypothetical protein
LEQSAQRKVKGTAKKSKRLCTGAPASTQTLEAVNHAAGTQPRARQAEFAHSSQCGGPDKRHQVTKAWDQGRGAREAAQHVQLCIQHHSSQRYKEQEGQPDTQHQERKAWEQHHGVIQSAQHVQSCLNHQSSIQSQAQAGHQANRCTASKGLSRREQAPGLPQAPAVNLLGAWKDNPQRTTA